MDVDNENSNDSTVSSSGKKRGNEHLPVDIAGLSTKRRQEELDEQGQFKESKETQAVTPVVTQAETQGGQQQEYTQLYCQELNGENPPPPPPPMVQPPFRPFDSSSSSSSRRRGAARKKKRIDSHQSVLPLSMQVIKPFWLLCCQNCEDTRNGRIQSSDGTSGAHSYLHTMLHSLNGMVSHENINSNSNNNNNNNGGSTVRESMPSFMNQNGHIVDTTSNTNTVAAGAHTNTNTAANNANTHIGTPPAATNHTMSTSNELTPLVQNHHQTVMNEHDVETSSTDSENGGINNNNLNGVGSVTTTGAHQQTQQAQLLTHTSDIRFQHLQTIPPTPQPHTNPIMQEYISTTQIYGCRNVNAGVLTALRFSLPTLRVSGSFHDSDMLALSEILFRHCNGSLSHIKRLDFSVASREGKLHGKKGFGSHGAFTLSRVLCISQYIEEVFVQRNKIGPYGAAAIFAAIAKNSTMKTLVMRRCVLGERGALAFAEYIGQSTVTGLKEVDLSVNRIGFKGSIAIEEMLHEKEKIGKSIDVDLEGNLVLQEVMNGVTHGLGIVLCVIGAVILTNRVKTHGRNHVVSCGVYSASLLVLYTSSTLYHSFFALKYTRYIFEVLDHCAIYILITGSYTPFLRIALENDPTASFYLLLFQWVCCVCGVFVEAFYNTWIHKPKFSLAMYLGMGWSCMICMPQFMEVLPTDAIKLLVLGGVGYTSGVPFFVRNNNLDHSIWHCFVLAGSIFHWFAVYLYVAPMTPCMDVQDDDNMNMACVIDPVMD